MESRFKKADLRKSLDLRKPPSLYTSGMIAWSSGADWPIKCQGNTLPRQRHIIRCIGVKLFGCLFVLVLGGFGGPWGPHYPFFHYSQTDCLVKEFTSSRFHLQYENICCELDMADYNFFQLCLFRICSQSHNFFQNSLCRVYNGWHEKNTHICNHS